MDEGPTWLVLRPFRTHQEITIFPDGRVVTANCGHFAWLSPEREHLMDASYTSCMDCSKDALADPGVKRVMVAGALEAVRRWAGDDGVAEAVAFMIENGLTREEDER